MLLPQPIGESAYVVAACEQLALLDMVKGEQLVVSVAHVVHAKVDAGLVCSGADHEVHHRFRHVDALLELFRSVILLSTVTTTTISSAWLLSLSRVRASVNTFNVLSVTVRVFHRRIIVSTDTSIVACLPSFYLAEVLRHPVLSSEFTPRLSGQVVDDFAGQSNVCHGVEDGHIRDVVADPHDPAVEAGLCSVHILSLPQPHRRKWSANIYQHRPCKATCQLLYHVGLRLADLPPQYLDVLVDLLPGNLELFLSIARHLHS